MEMSIMITMIVVIANSRPTHLIIELVHERVESEDRHVRAQEAIRDHVHPLMVVLVVV
jgi:hypothetical protein